MRHFVKIENGAPVQWPIAATHVWRLAPVNTSFPADCTNSDLTEFGFETLEMTNQPSYDADTHRAQEATPTQINGVWTQAWEVVALTDEEIAARLPPVPNSISDRQFAQALALSGLLTEAEALAWVKVGDVPAALQVVVDAIPDNDVRFSANMLLGGATIFERNHPMVAALAAGLEMSSEQIDAIWQLGATL